jgi:hypothetical protein
MLYNQRMFSQDTILNRINGGQPVINKATFKSLILTGSLALSVNSCKHAPADSSMESARRPNAISGDFYGCYKVTKAESAVDNVAMNDLKKSTSKICIVSTPGSRSGPITVEFKAKNGDMVNTAGFDAAAPQRCPGCYAFQSGLTGTAQLSQTMAANLYTFTANLNTYGGQIKFNMIIQPTQGLDAGQSCGGGIVGGLQCKPGLTCVGAHDNIPGRCQ